MSSLYDQAIPVASVPYVQVLSETWSGTPNPTMKQESENEFDDHDDSWNFHTAEMEKGDAILTSHALSLLLNGSMESGMINNADIFDDSSWGLKDPSSEFRYGNQGSVNLAESHEKFLAKVEIDELLEFYFKLKDELSLIALSHLYRIKESGLLM
ncbi:hypothetical protein SAY86_012453 [Trapa natans]|uniref:Uncharacterized protein n=1 Tax=Trapa natans TaxID=22666 RepID=A0AAN7LZW0_TRANT|nr:hypothetical protein SAY86_012453 [Trapa natans]